MFIKLYIQNEQNEFKNIFDVLINKYMKLVFMKVNYSEVPLLKYF